MKTSATGIERNTLADKCNKKAGGCGRYQGIGHAYRVRRDNAWVTLCDACLEKLEGKPPVETPIAEVVQLAPQVQRIAELAPVVAANAEAHEAAIAAERQAAAEVAAALRAPVAEAMKSPDPAIQRAAATVAASVGIVPEMPPKGNGPGFTFECGCYIKKSPRRIDVYPCSVEGGCVVALFPRGF